MHTFDDHTSSDTLVALPDELVGEAERGTCTLADAPRGEEDTP